MIEVVGVRFQRNKRIYYFNPQKKKLRTGAKVLVENVNGLEVVTVVKENKMIVEADIVLPLKLVVRILTKEDWEQVRTNEEKEEKASNIFMELIKKEALPMRLVAAKYNFDSSHLTFTYTADERVDFRQLVKKLAATFQVRIEMRQINMREKAALIGGVGPCGYDLCCSTFLNDLYGTTIKMVKNQKLSLIPERISGLCGKLLCCVRYEDDVYTILSEHLPDVNQRIQTPEGEGKVIYVNVLTQNVDVLFVKENGTKYRETFKYDSIKKELLELEA
ncbi:stage 0 sporulation protein [Erysipelotrichaceae bacterium]|nr:stage 0 sporulation protein [Erysipelotrichaceae bacterium]